MECLEARILGLHVKFVTEDGFCVAVLLPTGWLGLITTSIACSAGLATFIEVQQVVEFIAVQVDRLLLLHRVVCFARRHDVV